MLPADYLPAYFAAILIRLPLTLIEGCWIVTRYDNLGRSNLRQPLGYH
jgi:hypothetical protein